MQLFPYGSWPCALNKAPFPLKTSQEFFLHRLLPAHITSIPRVDPSEESLWGSGGGGVESSGAAHVETPKGTPLGNAARNISSPFTKGGDWFASSFIDKAMKQRHLLPRKPQRRGRPKWCHHALLRTRTTPKPCPESALCKPWGRSSGRNLPFPPSFAAYPARSSEVLNYVSQNPLRS